MSRAQIAAREAALAPTGRRAPVGAVRASDCPEESVARPRGVRWRFVGRAAAVLLLSAVASAGGRLARAEFELAGPLSALEVSAGGGGRLAVAGELAPGETMRLVLPVPLSEEQLLAPPEPRAAWTLDEDAPRGRARFLRWVEDPGARAVESAPAALRGRSRPPVRAETALPGFASAALLAALAALIVALRRKPALAFALALPSAALAAGLVPRPGAGARSERIFEGVGGIEAGLEVRAGAGELRLPAWLWEAGGTLATEPRDAPVAVELSGFGPRAALRLAVRDARLLWTRTAPLAPGVGFERNDGPELAGVWVRREGEWRALGPWPAGSAAPEGRLGLPPEGWLVAGLPQGCDVLVARALDGEGPLWLRLTR